MVTKSNYTSTIVMLAGPIEYWWDCPEEPDRFMSLAAQEYRAWREEVSNFLEVHDFLVYRPWNAFKGQWDERAQPINNWVVNVADIIVNLNPGVPAKGTAEEIALAKKLGKPVFKCPPGSDLEELKRRLDLARPNRV